MWSLPHVPWNTPNSQRLWINISGNSPLKDPFAGAVQWRRTHVGSYALTNL